MGATPCTWNFRSNWPRFSEIADFRSLFSCSGPAVTPVWKVQLTLIQSPLHTFQWAQDEHRTLSLSPAKGGSKTQSVRNLNNCDNSETVRDRMSVTINHYIASRIQAFDWYRLRWPWMTLDAVIALILRFLTEFDIFSGRLYHSGWR